MKTEQVNLANVYLFVCTLLCLTLQVQRAILRFPLDLAVRRVAKDGKARSMDAHRHNSDLCA